jgi:hypothetical protein
MLWTPQRKSQRFHISVAVRISGEDRMGSRFDVEAWTVDVGSDGACIHVPVQLWIPRRLHVVCDDYQFHANADVDVVWERTEPHRTIGVRIVEGTPASAWQAR